MRTTEQYVDILKRYKHSAAKKFGIARIGIFGSVARHEHTEASDIDVCVQLQRPDLYALVHIKDDLENIFQKPVDIVHLHPHMDRMLQQCIQKDCLYAD